MATRQYIGARYVPKFADPIAWDNTRSYEALEIVTNLGTSYTSKKPVPVGVAISNTEYWVATGNYNAQVEQYREEVEALSENMNTGFKSVVEFMGTGISDTTALLNCAAACVSENCGLLIPADVTLSLAADTVLSGVRKIRSYGTIIPSTGFEVHVPAKIDSVEQNNLDWYFYEIQGKVRMSGAKRGIITVIRAEELELFADSTVTEKYSFAYNTFFLGMIDTFRMTGLNSGWINENQFFGGDITNLYITGENYTHNNNHWYLPCLEGATVEINNAKSNYFHTVRAENVASITFGDMTFGNYFEITNISIGFTLWDGIGYGAWHDTYGRNFLVVAGRPAMKEYTKEYTINTLNYESAGKTYISSGKLHNDQYNDGFLTTGLIPIDKFVYLHAEADANFMRGRITCFDANGDQITTEPETAPIRAIGAAWNDTNHCYQLATSNVGAFNIDCSRYGFAKAADSGVAYVQLMISGYGAANFEKFQAKVLTWDYNNIPYPFKANRLESASQPGASVTFPSPVVVFNSAANASVLGWWNKVGTWTEIS